MAAYVLCWFLGIERIGAASPTLVALCLPPVLVTIVAVARRRERLDAALLAVLGAALSGTTLSVRQHGGGPGGVDTATLAAGIGVSVASAVLYAAFTLVSGRPANALGAGPATTGRTVVAAAVMALAGFVTPLNRPTDWPPEAWFRYLGVVTAALALLAFSWGVARLTPTALTVATLVEPPTAVLLAALLLGAIGALGRRVSAAAPHA